MVEERSGLLQVIPSAVAAASQMGLGNRLAAAWGARASSRVRFRGEVGDAEQYLWDEPSAPSPQWTWLEEGSIGSRRFAP